MRIPAHEPASLTRLVAENVGPRPPQHVDAVAIALTGLSGLLEDSARFADELRASLAVGSVVICGDCLATPVGACRPTTSICTRCTTWTGPRPGRRSGRR